MASRHHTGWDEIYHRYRPEQLPWELGKPRKGLVELVKSGLVASGKVLDLCCGAGTNTAYLAKKGFDVTALDISDEAVRYANKKAREEEVDINLLVGDNLRLPFKSEEFDFAFDFGCFHHVKPDNRTTFITGVHRVLKPKSAYFLVCFSDKNGPAWNHFRKQQIVNLFTGYFDIEWIKHVSSVEGDNVTRYFYEVLMKRSVSSKK
jgi:ubiquinone/menaquinone biosynthesis C-methylase UbiE